MKRTITVTALLLALLSVPFPLIAQQSIGYARAGTLERNQTVDLLHESAVRNAALAISAVPRHRGARLLHPKSSASTASAEISRALTAGQTSQTQLVVPT